MTQPCLFVDGPHLIGQARSYQDTPSLDFDDARKATTRIGVIYTGLPPHQTPVTMSATVGANHSAFTTAGARAHAAH